MNPISKGRTTWFLVLAWFLVLEGCAGFKAGIKEVTVLKTAPPYAGNVEIRLKPEQSTAPVLFEMKIFTKVVGLPSQDLMVEIKQEAAKLGANVLVFDCGAPGTVGQRLCVARGHREQSR
jgi:hypothetical protein